MSHGHTAPYLTARPLSPLVSAWARSKTLSTSEPTVNRFPHLMILGQLPAAHSYHSLANLASLGDHNCLPGKETSVALKLVKSAAAWLQEGLCHKRDSGEPTEPSEDTPPPAPFREHNFMSLNKVTTQT